MTPFLLAMLVASPNGYDAAYAKALAEQKPLVVFVGIPAFPVEGAVIHAEPKGFAWHSKPGVLVALPRSGWLEWAYTLHCTAGPDEVRRLAIRPAIVAPPVIRYAPPPFIAPMPTMMPMMMRGGGGGGSC